MVKIAPSLLSADFSALMDDMKRAAPYCELFHVDVMDGHFVPNITIGIPVVKALRKALDREGLAHPLDVHLMIENPDRFIPEFAAAGADIISVHEETCFHLHRTLSHIRENGAKPAVALNPTTRIDTLDHVLRDIDMVLVMSVNPGFGGQSFIDSAVPKIRSLASRVREVEKETGHHVDIEVDGGITAETAPAVVAAGADILVAGSAVFGNIYAEGKRDIEGSLRVLREATGQ